MRNPRENEFPNKFLSYAQNFEDVLLWRALGHIDKGFYIDLGAAHPDVESVTRAFYERGWCGINVEPVNENSRRLAAARLRDINLRVAVGAAPGTTNFFVIPGTGLSTVDQKLAESYRAKGYQHERIKVAVETLRSICQRHVRSEIHFLKIDVEGSELAALSGADFDTFRPWIVLVEATEPTSVIESFSEWESVLTRAGYAFVWFDGLNRFYVANEHRDTLERHFRSPPNVFDNFIRAADTEWVPKLNEAEARHSALREELRDAQARLTSNRADITTLKAEVAQWGDEYAQLSETLDVVVERAESAAAWLRLLHGSTSWRLTAPMRRVMKLLAGRRGTSAPVIDDVIAVFDHMGPAPAERSPDGPLPGRPPLDASAVKEPPAAKDPPPLPRPIANLKRAVHQFHSGSAKGDAITNAMLMCRDLLRGLGYHSEIFVEWPDPALGQELRPLAELPRHDDYVLIVRHSTGYDAFDTIRALPAIKVLIYHNITPAEFMPENRRHHARLGRSQLAAWRGHVAATLADSEFNVIELRALGFEDARACALLFDLDAMMANVTPRIADGNSKVLTILFVGRVTPSKAQDQLIEAYAMFRRKTSAPTRLVLVGRQDEPDAAYVKALRDRIQAAELQQHVILTGLISDAARDAWYANADMYVSLSLHEGFGVPLVEAVTRGLPVLAVPDGAIPYTLGDVPGALLTDRSPASVAAAMLALANDAAARAELARRQRTVLDRFRLQFQLPRLMHALALAGAAPPADPASRPLAESNLHFTVTGHISGSYSLATVNRTVATALEKSFPGRVRVVPVEGVPTDDISGVPPEERPALSVLVDRSPPTSGPRVVISQHYPVFTRSPPGDTTLAMFFWEESVVPAATVTVLNNAFRGVLAPSRFVAKALIDSGVALPVHVVGYAPEIGDFQELGAHRQYRETGPGKSPFTFLHVSSCFPRKGVDVLLTAWASAFRRGDGARLVIKGFPNPHNDVEEQIAALRRTDPDLGEIEYFNREMTRSEMLALYRDADAMVLPSRGEGFNIPAVEAMAAGLPLLVTGGGGHMDFCNNARGRLIDFHFGPSRSHLSTPFSLWMEPEPDHLAREMRGMFQNRAPDDATSRGAHRARLVAAAVADAESFSARIANASLDILLAPPRGPMRLTWVTTWDVRCGVAEYSRNLLEAMPVIPRVAPISVLCDERTEPSAADEGIQASPAWTVGKPESMPNLATAIAREDPDVVVVQHQPGLIAWHALTQLLGSHAMTKRRVVITLHSTHHLMDVEPRIRDAALAALARVDRVLVHTIGDLNFLKNQGLAANVTRMPHAVRSFRGMRVARPLTPQSTPLIGCYGFFLKGKGIPQLMAAMPLIRGVFPNARLRLVNADYGSRESAAEISACRRATARAGLDDVVDFQTDFVSNDESLTLLEECDVVALPYQGSRESSSAALRTALSAGVALAVTPLPMFDEAEDAVIRFAGLDSEALATGIIDLLRDHKKRLDVQIAAQRWLGEHDRDKIARRFQNMLLGLTASPRMIGPAFRWLT